VYEPDFYLPFVHEIREGMTVIDVGAHVGFFSLGAALRAGAPGKVCAFEPSPETFDILKKHICLNGWEDRIEALQGVVGDHDGTTAFYTYGTSMAASVSQANVEVLNPEVRDRPAARIDSTSFSLDSFCSKRGLKPDVIKVDVEGAEVQVLRGARNLLSTLPIVVFCEVHPAQMANCGASIEEFHSLIESLRLRAEPLDDPNPVGIYHAKISRL
jgi:FkbM family methyltransferase